VDLQVCVTLRRGGWGGARRGWMTGSWFPLDSLVLPYPHSPTAVASLRNVSWCHLVTKMTLDVRLFTGEVALTHGLPG
jgi:hypothetical protein